MIAKVYNQNFGWSVACGGYWAAVGNPCTFRYDPLTGSLIRTGSVEIFRYNINTDVHDFKTILHRPLTPVEVMLLSTEYANIPPTGPDYYIHTEYTGSVPITADKDLLVDTGQYYSASEDGYGFSLDIMEPLLVVGNPYFESRFTFATKSFFYTGSGYVDLYDLSKLDIDPYAKRIAPAITVHSFTGGIPGLDLIGVNVPGFQDYRYVYIQTKNTTIPGDDWQNVVGGIPPAEGGMFYLQTYYTSTDEIPLEFRVIGIVGTDPYLSTLYNPNSAVTESFGWSVSVNDEWLAVGSPLESGSMGSVFMFRKIAQDISSWSFVQSVPLPTDIGTGDGFGWSIEVNKATSSFSWSMVVGSSKYSHSRAYIYEFDGTNWKHNFTLYPDNTTLFPLPFYPTKPIISGYPNYADWFGYSVSMFEDSVIVGAPKDRVIQEFEGSSYYDEGAVYFFQRCPNRDHGYYFVKKSYGNQKIMKNNMLGWSVDINDSYAVAGVPKITALSSSICYLRGSLFQKHYCEATDESSLQGQFVLYNKITASLSDINWDITNIYQVKKRYLSPYRVYGWDVSLCDQFVTIGAPMLISGSNTVMSFYKESPFVPLNLTVVSSSAALGWQYDYIYSEQDGFNIEKSLDGNIFNNLYTLSNPDSRSYVDTAVSVNNTYYYRINAYNDVGVSSYSNVVSIFFPPPPPANPTVLTVQSGSSTGPSVLNWTYTNDYQLGFNVEKSTDGIIYSPLTTIPNPVTRTYLDLFVSVNNTYWYRVNAYNGTGVSPYSNTASIFYIIPVPTGPTVLSVATGSLASQSFNSASSVLSWSYTTTTQTGWNIEKSSSASPGFINISTFAVPTLRTYVDSASIDANSTYWYRVQPFNGYGTGSYSNNDSASFSNVLYFSGSEKYYINPTGYINESSQSWKGCFGYKNVNLTHLNVASCSLTTLNLISASILSILTCSFNKLTSLDMRSSPLISYFDCRNNLLTSLNVTSCSTLANFYCLNNQLPSLDVTSCTNLFDFNCNSNQITSLDVTKNVNLVNFSFNNNLLTTMDARNNHVLQFLGGDSNLLSALYVSSSTAYYISVTHNQLTTSSVNFDECPNLSTLLISDNLFNTIDIGHRSASLVTLGIANNPLYKSGGIFDATPYVNLSTLYASSDGLTAIDLTQCPLLFQTQLYANQFPSIDLTGNPVLVFLDVSINGVLEGLDCSNNISVSVIGAHENYSMTHFSSSISTSFLTLAGNFNVVQDGSGSINQVYLDLDQNGVMNGYLNLLGTKPPSGSSIIAARSNLISKGWSITDEYGILTYTPSSSLIRWTDTFGTHGPSNIFTYWAAADSQSVSEIHVGSGSNGGDPLVSISGLQFLPVLKTASLYNNLLTSLDLTNVTALLYLSASHNLFTSGQVDYILDGLVNEFIPDGFVYLDKQTPPAPPTNPGGGYPNGLAATASLKTVGWIVVTDNS
jgi:hypothetical protein